MTSDNGDITAFGVQKIFANISILGLCAALSGCAGSYGQNAPPSGYVVYQSVPLDPVESGIQGSLQILQDKRVTPEYRKTWGMSNVPHPDISLQKGRLRLVDKNGKTIFNEELAAPLAKVKKEFLYGTKFPTYLVTTDLGTGMGSYNGPVTMLVEAREGKLQHIQAVGDTGKENDIGLMQSLKNAWRIVPALGDSGKEIREVQCFNNWGNPPNGEDEEEFLIVYTTYRFQDGKWHRFSRQKIGYWDYEGNESWPNPSQFP